MNSTASAGSPGPLDLLIEGAGEVFTASGPIQPAGTLVGIRAGRIAWIGSPDALAASGWSIGERTTRFDAGGGLVTPGLVECHTHLIYAGDRAQEYAERAAGRPYASIAAAGGGIATTVRATRAADLPTLVDLATPRLDALLAHGVTTAEVKSGYGLDWPTERRILQAVAALHARHPVDLVGTFLGAHTVPPERRADRGAFVREICEEMIPKVAAERLAEFCDVFVEQGAFTLAEAEAVLRAGLEHGLRPKVHADQLSPGGGAALAARLGAVSADHLEHTPPEVLPALAAAGTVAVLLPGAALFLGQDERPPARALIDAGVPVALSTDCNPGTCNTENLLLMLTLGMSRLGMSAVEVLHAVTTHAARAIGREDTAGALAVGRPADVAVFDVPSHAHLPYRFGVPVTRAVFKSGAQVYSGARE